MHELAALGVVGLSRALKTRAVSAREAALACLREVERREPGLHAFLTVTEEEALAQADWVDARRAAGEPLSPLAGIPFGLKDNICTRGIRTTCASRMLESFVPPYSAAAAERLSQSVLLGKLNMDEFGMGNSTQCSAFGGTANPWDETRVPGGSSGGAAAAVAAGEVLFALGSDTGGSVRQPAAFCGVTGLKPTYGRVSRYGLVAFASSLDQIGPLARDVRGCAAVYQEIAGHDPRDATSSPAPVEDCLQDLEKGAAGLRAALPREALELAGPDARRCTLEAARALEQMGARVEEISLPFWKDMLPAYYVLSSAEASSNLARYDGVRYGRRAQGAGSWQELMRRSRSEGFGREVKRRILLGAFVLTKERFEAYYARAQRVRQAAAAGLAGVLGRCDLLLTPTSPEGPWQRGRSLPPASAYQADLFTVPASMAGLPALSLPFGTDREGLPVGVQLIGRAFEEKLLLQAAFALEEAGKGAGL